jgi:hypothetical protein
LGKRVGKKKQKTFAHESDAAMDKSFLVLFFKKELLSDFPPVFSPQISHAISRMAVAKPPR